MTVISTVIPNSYLSYKSLFWRRYFYNDVITETIFHQLFGKDGNLLKKFRNVGSTTFRPLPWIRVVIKHSWHHVSKRSCILGSKLFALLIIIMRHIQPFLQHGQHNRISLIVLLKSTYTIFHFLFEIKFWTYTWPNSWAMVNAALNPLSCTIAQLCLPHMVPNSARPNVSQFSLGRVGLRQISSL